jgi:mRNA interferase HicA
MRGSDFLRRVQKCARENGVACSWHPDKGKGSHGVLKYGDKRTVLRNLKDELKTGTCHAMLKQLGLEYDDIFQR